MPFHELISTEWDSQLSKFLLCEIHSNPEQLTNKVSSHCITNHLKTIKCTLRRRHKIPFATINKKKKMNVHCSCFILFNAVYKWNYRIYYHQFVRGPLLRDICIIGKGWMKRVVEPSKGCGVILQHFSQHNKTCLYPQPTTIKSVTFIHSFHLPLHQAATENMKIKHFHILP